MIDVTELRSRLGIKSQAALAEMVGVDQSTVSRWESGDLQPSGPALILLKQMASQPNDSATKSAAE